MIKWCEMRRLSPRHQEYNRHVNIEISNYKCLQSLSWSSWWLTHRFSCLPSTKEPSFWVLTLSSAQPPSLLLQVADHFQFHLSAVCTCRPCFPCWEMVLPWVSGKGNHATVVSPLLGPASLSYGPELLTFQLLVDFYQRSRGPTYLSFSPDIFLWPWMREGISASVFKNIP